MKEYNEQKTHTNCSIDIYFKYFDLLVMFILSKVDRNWCKQMYNIWTLCVCVRFHLVLFSLRFPVGLCA